MIDKNKSGESVSLIKAILVLLGNLIFSLLFSLLIMEISIIMVLIFNGSSEFTLYLHMFEWTHTNISYSLPEQYRWTLGYLINLAVSTITYLIFIRKRNQNFIPLLTWAPIAFNYTSFAILAGAWSGFLPQEILTIFHYTFLVIGFILTLSIRPLLYNARKTPLWKLLIINSCVWPIFTLFRALYIADYNLANLDPSIIIAFLVIALLFSLLEKPLYPLFERIMHIRTNDINWRTIIISCSLALLFLVIFSISPYEPYSEKIYLSDLITFIISMGISIVGVIMIIARFDVLRIDFKREVVEITKKKEIKEKKIAVVEEKREKEELILEVLPEEVYVEQETQEEIERAPDDLPIEEFKYDDTQPPIEEVESILEEKEIETIFIEEEEFIVEKVDLIEKILEKKEIIEDEVSSTQEFTEEISEIYEEPEQSKIAEEIEYRKIIEKEVGLVEIKKETEFKEEIIEKEEVIGEKDLSFKDVIKEEISPEQAVEINVIEEIETEKEEILEKIKILPTGNLVCQYCGFNNPDDAIYCIQCGQTIIAR